jgi:hypothetical protein
MSTVTYLPYDITAATCKGRPPKPRLDAYGYTSPSGSPTIYQVKINGGGRWHRVYALQFSNAASHFVRHKGQRLLLNHNHISAIEDFVKQES